MSETQPFNGVRILDLTHVLAGPFSTFQLACLGADVIKVESPNNPDMTRSEGVDVDQNRNGYGSYFYSQNAGKRAVCINLKSEEGKEILWRLIATADVLVQNYAGNALEQLGFGYEAVAKANPSLIYCKISGFGSTGPKADHPAYDVVIQAYSGLMAANGEANSEPVRVGPPMVDYGTGAQAAFAISAALYQRQQTGHGQFIDVSMLDAALMLMSALVVDTSITNTAPQAHGNAHPNYAGYNTYPTASGSLMIGAWTNKQFAALMTVLGHHDRAHAITETPRENIGNTRDADAELIACSLLEKTADEWEEILNQAHVPAARVRTLNETLQEEQLTFRGVMQTVPNTHSACPGKLPVTAFTYHHGTPSIASAPATLGQHTNQILEEVDFGADDIEQMRSNGIVY